MTLRGAALVGAVLLGACTHYNTLYNAERVYESAERERRAGRDSLALVQYRDVVRKTADAYRSRPDDDRAPEILYLLGRAQLRAGEPRAAASALQEAAARATTSERRSHALVYLAAAKARLADADGAVATLEEALRGNVTGEALAEARLLRGSLRLSGDSDNQGWSELAAATADPALRVEAGLEHLRLSVEHGERERAREAVTFLLSERTAGERLDTLSRLVHRAGSIWGWAAAADLMGAADSTRWDQPHRGLVRLERASLLYEAGDSLGARALAGRVATGRGQAAVEARLTLAGWRLAAARDLGVAASVRPLLLPVSGEPRVRDVLLALDEVERHAALGLDQPLGWFAAAEVARDRLGAPMLARGFFLAYADFDPTDPWAPKALLAALDTSRDPADHDWLRGRLEAHDSSPYVLAARGRPSAAMDDLEEELRVRLQEITGR